MTKEELLETPRENLYYYMGGGIVALAFCNKVPNRRLFRFMNLDTNKFINLKEHELRDITKNPHDIMRGAAKLWALAVERIEENPTLLKKFVFFRPSGSPLEQVEYDCR
jgi:hypothetical protein